MEQNVRCQVVIIGSQRNRVAKVLTYLKDNTLYTSKDHQANNKINITIDYLPCVATFDSYVNDETNEVVRYLLSVKYHGIDGQQKQGSSVASFFDEDENDEDKESNTVNLGVVAVAIGSGIEADDDVDKIRSFIGLLSQGINEEKNKKFLSLNANVDVEFPFIDVVRPNTDFSSMKEEMDVYKAMTAEEKESANEMGTFGPGKMARFAHNLVDTILSSLMKKDDVETTPQDSSPIDEKCPNLEYESISSPSLSPYEIAMKFLPPEELSIKTHYSCRMCRTPLFTVDHLENPPHKVAKHNFNHKKKVQTTSSCQSVFLAEGLPWMGDITLQMEGRIVCPKPKCQAKVGIWKWAGTQCSCGTWVTPAIQFPLSKVDKIQPGVLNANFTGVSCPMVINPSKF